jgi:ketosteroid isomerase-like protein
VSQKLDLVRSIYADWERGDFTSPEWAHPEIEFVVKGGLATGAWTGVAALGEQSRALQDVWSEFRMHADEYRELDEERVLVFFTGSGHGKSSGIDVDRLQTQGANLFHVRDGIVARLVLYYDRTSALTDLGLEQ